MSKHTGKHIDRELPQLDLLQKELKRELYKRRFRRLLRSTVNALIVVASVAALIATLVLPVLQIAFYYSNKILIKRIIATPGDYLWINPDGTVYLNGEELQEPYVSEKALGECDVEFPYQVPENNFFMMGDHRETSIDSRSSVIGCIAQDQIIGKILCRFWPLSEFTWMA